MDTHFLRPEAKENLIKYLIPMAYLVTPNVPEAEEITGIKIENVEDMKKAGKEILNLGPKYVLMKGGHLDGDAVDILMGENLFEVFSSERINKKYTWNRLHIIFCNNFTHSAWI